MTSLSGADLTVDDFLGGRVHLTQPRLGYRAGVDPVLLAACVPAKPGDSVLDLGCGAGAALFCLGARVQGLALTGVELQPDYAGLARENARKNGIAATIVTADLADLPADLRNTTFHHVTMNPPYFDRSRGTVSTDAGRNTALGGETPLSVWIDTGLRRLRPKGTFTLIQRIERLPEVLGALDGRLGSVVVQPLAARIGRDAGLFVVQGRKGGRAAFRLCAPLVMHGPPVHERDGDDYSDQLRGILRDGNFLPLGG